MFSISTPKISTMKTIISTVGTSIFENYLNKFGRKDSGFNDAYDTQRKGNFQYKCWSEFNDSDIKPLCEKFKSKTYHKHSDISAEIASIIAIQKELGEEVRVHLLATDTILSVLAAELIKQWFEEEGNKERYPGIKKVAFKRPEPGFRNQKDSEYVILDLRIDNQDAYDKGVLNLIYVLNSLYKVEDGKKKEKPIVNITGGYKSIIPIVTIWAQLEELELRYLFNESEVSNLGSTISLPSLPVNFDWEVAQSVTQYLSDKIINVNDPRNPYFIENFDNGTREMLIDWKLITPDGKQLTSLANLLKLFVEKRSAISKDSVLGMLMEYKYYEFFNEFNNDYEYPTKGVDFGYYYYKDAAWSQDEISAHLSIEIESFSDQIKIFNEQKAEEEKVFTIGDIDLVFRHKETKSVVMGEVKAFGAWDTNYGQKIWRKILAFEKKREEKPITFCLLLYNVKFQHEPNKDYSRDRKLLDKLKMVSDFVKSKSGVLLSVFICDIQLSDDSFKVHYDDLLRKPITPVPIDRKLFDDF